MVDSQLRSEIRDFWRFYRSYADTAVHAASTAALAIFGILVFVDPWFAILAIASYVLPPVALYLTRGAEPGDETGEATGSARDRPSPAASESSRPGESRSRYGGGQNVPDDRGAGVGDGDTDSDADDGDTDSDAGDGDTDTDRRGSDTDSDT